MIEGTRDVNAALARTALALPLDGTSLPDSDPPTRHEGSPAVAAAPSALRLPAAIEAGGRRVRVELGAAEGWGRNSSSLIALPHGMEAHTCIATLTPHQAPRDAPWLATADSPGTGPGVSSGTREAGAAATVVGRPGSEDGAPADTALLFLILKSGRALRFQARL